MRTRTEDRRQAILDAARSVFREVGYERASMSEIARRLGGSKATLYGYFSSKEELFIATVHQEIESTTFGIVERVRKEPDLKAGLRLFGRSYLSVALDPATLGLFRQVGMQPPENGIGQAFYEQGIKRGRERMAEYVKEAMDRGELRQADPWLATTHLKCLLDSDLLEPALLNAQPPASEARRAKAVETAIDLFLRAYGP